MGLFVEDDRRLVNDLVLSTDPVCGASATLSFASSNVSYADQRLAKLCMDSVRLRSERSCDTVGTDMGVGIAAYMFPIRCISIGFSPLLLRLRRLIVPTIRHLMNVESSLRSCDGRGSCQEMEDAIQ